MTTTQQPRVYLAGPDVFRPNPKAWAEKAKAICAEHGLIGVFPLDNELPWPPGVSKPQMAAMIRAANIDLIKSCDMVIANVSPFRGPNADDGTAWEMGFAEALGKPVIGWTEREILNYCGHVDEWDYHVNLRLRADGNGWTVEDFKLPCNLMLAAGPYPIQPSLAAACRVAARIWHQPTGQGREEAQASI